MDSLAEQIIVGILAAELELPTDTIWLGNQNRQIPNDKRLYVVVTMADSQLIANSNYCEPTEDGMTETQEVQVKENIQIDIISRDTSALFRRWEIMAALNSVYSVQAQEANYFKIFRLPQSFINTSETEGGSILNKYSLVVPCFVWYRKTKALNDTNGNYFDSFDTRVDDEKTIGTAHGIIEFTTGA